MYYTTSNSSMMLAVVLSLVVVLSTSIIEAKEEKFQDNIIKGSAQDEKEVQQNEIDDRIRVVEPYKSMLQTTARFALAQTKVSNHVNIDTAMDLLNDAGYMLSKPANLFRVIKVVASLITILITTTFFFPGAHKFISAAWRNPVNALNLDKHLSNGINEKSMLDIIGSKTDDALGRIGLQDSSCKQRSLCYMGEILKCSFPETANSITRFTSDNFSNTGIKENVYAKAFISGFVDRNCTKVGSDAPETSHNCLSKLVNSILVSTHDNSINSQQSPRSRVK